MATLRAHGQEVGRLIFERKITDSIAIDHLKTTYAFMEDGWILKKEQMHFKEKEGLSYPAYWWDRGWHRKKKIKVVIIDYLEECYQDALRKGKTVTKKIC
jgi:hypothetical protein